MNENWRQAELVDQFISSKPRLPATMELSKHDLASMNGHNGVVPKANCMTMAAPHLLMVPYPSQPHMLPMLSLARQIASHGGIKITYVCFQSLIDRLLKSESNVSDSIQLVGVPDELPGFDSPSELPQNIIVLRESFQLGYCMGPFVEKLLQDQHNLQGPTSMITDWLNWWGIDIATKLGIPRYVLSVNPALFVQLMMNSPLKGYHVDDKDGFIRVPGVHGFQIHHLANACRSDNDQCEEFLTRWPKCALESDGVLVNMCLAVEAEVIKALPETVAITLAFNKDLFVKADDFAKAINVVLQSEEGTRMRESMGKYKTNIGVELVPGGSSHAAIREFANIIKGGPVSVYLDLFQNSFK